MRGAKTSPRGIRFHFISSVSMKYFTANIFMPLVCVLCLALPLWSCVWCLPLPCGLVCGFWLYRCGLVCGVWHYHFSLMCFEDVIVEIRWGCSHCTEQVMQMYYTVICKPLVICTEGDWRGKRFLEMRDDSGRKGVSFVHAYYNNINCGLLK